MNIVWNGSLIAYGKVNGAWPQPRGISALTAKVGYTTHMGSMQELADIQREVFEFVRDEIANGRPAPTLRELATTFGWSSKRAAACHIEAIVRKGWLAM